MKQRPRIYCSETQKALMWDRWRKGDTIHEPACLRAARTCGSMSSPGSVSAI